VAAQPSSSLAELKWSASDTGDGRFVIAPGQRAFVGGYRSPGLEVWIYPLQLVHSYWISFHLEGDANEIDGRSALRSVEQTPTTATREYAAAGVTLREQIAAADSIPAAAIAYTLTSKRAAIITIHFTPSLNLMWPGAVGGQEIHWDSTHSAFTLDEPSLRFRGVIASPQIITHEQVLNNRRDAEFERIRSFTMRVAPGSGSTVTFAGASTPADDPLVFATNPSVVRNAELRARARYAALRAMDIETPDTAVNRALHWAQITLEQAWVCNPQLGCGLVAGYGPSRGARRPQYAWFFAGDGLVAVDGLLREGAYERAREELSFIMRYRNKRTGAIWHELSQSAGFLDWVGAYPYMFVHVDVSFDFLNTLRDYLQTTGDTAFVTAHWDDIRAAYDYCRSTIPPNGTLPEIPAGQQGRDEQDPQRDELTLSLAWVRAAESFATLARLTNHGALAAAAADASVRARKAIRPTYYDAARGRWLSGHLRSGAPVEGLTSSAIALLHERLLRDDEQRALLDELASPPFRAPWGIRSTPTNSPYYDPDSYARGSVWAIGTADAIRAFQEAGRWDAATALWQALIPWFGLDAPGHMHEVLRGDVFAPERESVPDQTWSAVSFLSSAVRDVLGIEMDAAKRELRFAPNLPAEWRSLRVRHVRLADAEINLAVEASPDSSVLTIENSGPAMTLVFRVHAPRDRYALNAITSDGRPVLRVGSAGDTYEVRIPCPANRTIRFALRFPRRVR
jgi:glycogen debranching enzyme